MKHVIHSLVKRSFHHADFHEIPKVMKSITWKSSEWNFIQISKEYGT